jgi:hypothetical protein
MSERRVLLACDLDSQVFGALPVALAFAARGWRVTFAIESSSTLPTPLLERLAGRFGLIERSIAALPTDEEAFRHDAIGVFVTGSRLALFRHTLDLAARVAGRPRPALFCGFNGLVFEKFEEGVAWRLGYDVIGLNGPRDRDAFVDFLHATDFAKQPSVIVGLRRKTDTPPRPLKVPVAADPGIDPWIDQENASDATAPDEAVRSSSQSGAGAGDFASGSPRTADESSEIDPHEASPPMAVAPTASGSRGRRKLFVFAEQVVVPRTLRERQALVATLARLAEASPGWDVRLKARVRPDEQTFHAQPNHVAKLVKALKDKPKNFQITYEPLDELLDRADLFATVSSTALFDAFDFGVPSMVATDFGLRNADGAHVFFASGLLVRLCDLPTLDDAPIQAPDARWMRRMGYGDPYSPSALVDWLDHFDPARPLPRPFVSFAAAAGVAAATPAQAAEIRDAFERVEATLAAGGGAEANARSELTLLGFALKAALAPAAGKAPKPPAPKTPVRVEGPIAAYSRRLGMYWLVKRTRQKFGLPIYAPRG